MTDLAHMPRRPAAVVIPIYASDPHDVVFIERAGHLRRHAGQIAFPGGAVDAADGGDHARAALRELHEEIGIPPAAVTIVGRLADVRQRRNVFNVTPFVAIVAAGTPLTLDRNEVFAVHRVPLSAVLAAGAVHPGIEHIDDRRVETIHFDYGTMHVWGLTGNILHAFVQRYGDAESPLRAAIDAQLSA
jgi:8-oxo-dGTP pyrophosphatase MutT (NUDIX family)